jgi:glycerol-3-phosphate dehydrogenase
MQLRDQNVEQLASRNFDVLVIGGGINGAVSAAALSAKGANVALIEQRDFAGFTSQESSNLAWGGIKYLETFEFGLVRQLCQSRNRLMRHYPSTVREMRFLTTIPRGFRHHPLMLWLGAWVYWLMGKGFTQTPHYLSAQRLQREEALLNTDLSRGGLEYSDAYLEDNDARFTFQFVRAAMDHGCCAANYVQALDMRRDNGHWMVQARDAVSGHTFAIRARVLINATGPFVDDLNRQSGQRTEHQHVFSKGIHLIVNRLTPNRRVLAFFADDGRLFFAIPMGSRTCIGTTDTRVGTPFVAVTDDDRRFVLANINRRLRLNTPLTRQDIIAERCGVRPLAVMQEAVDNSGDFLKLSRQHIVEADRQQAVLSIFGGKLTDCLNIGDEVCVEVQAMGIRLPHPRQRWYGEADAAVKQAFLQQVRDIDLDRYTPASASEPLSARLWRRYGAAAMHLVEAIRAEPKQAEIVMGAYMRCELQQAAEREMIVKLDDFLRRRTTLALEMRREDLKQDAGLMDTCTLLFGSEAQSKYDEYFQARDGVTHS